MFWLFVHFNSHQKGLCTVQHPSHQHDIKDRGNASGNEIHGQWSAQNITESANDPRGTQQIQIKTNRSSSLLRLSAKSIIFYSIFIFHCIQVMKRYTPTVYNYTHFPAIYFDAPKFCHSSITCYSLFTRECHPCILFSLLIDCQRNSISFLT